jgi:hypothetical protein
VGDLAHCFIPGSRALGMKILQDPADPIWERLSVPLCADKQPSQSVILHQREGW